MKLVVFIVSLCALAAAAAAAAMVPRDTSTTTAVNSTTSEAPPSTIICAPYTPCAWEIYTPESRRPQNFIVNKYCVCSQETSCQEYFDNTEIFSVIYRCLPTPTTPSSTETDATTS